jgi:hypothetical protein
LLDAAAHARLLSSLNADGDGAPKGNKKPRVQRVTWAFHGQ